MRTWIAIGIAAAALTGAKLARVGATAERGSLEVISEPYTPSMAAAPFVSLGYREALASLLYVRLRGYYGGYYDTTAEGVASLGEAIVTLDPRFERVYAFTASAMTIAPRGVSQETYKRSIALLERGMPLFPENYEIPLLAGQTYLQDLKTDDPKERRAWDEKGVLLVESAIRKPKAPRRASAEWVAVIRTRLGQRERAIQGLRELLLITQDPRLRVSLTERLAKLEESDATEVAAEIYEMRKRFENAWKTERPSLRASMYILVGKPLGQSFDLAELATGGLDFVGAEQGFERLEPLFQEAAPAAPKPEPPKSDPLK